MSLRKNPHDNADPKVDPAPSSNTEKPPEEWVSGQDPMTGAQASCLKTLSEEAAEPDAFDETLSKAEASQRIDALRAKLKRERHSGVDRRPRT